MREIEEFNAILASEARQREIVSEELAEIVDKFGDERRTQLIPYEGDMSAEDLIAEEDVVVTITRGGYAKRTKTDLYRAQRRGGKGVRGAQLRQDDLVEHFFVTTTHHWILFFTNKGRVYRAKAYELPEAGRDARGQHVANLLAFQPDEQHRPGHRPQGLRGRAVPRARDQARHGEEDPADRVRLEPHRRADRDQPARGRRAGRRAHLGALVAAEDDLLLVSRQGAVGAVHRYRRRPAPDGPGHLGRDRHAVPGRRRAARDGGRPAGAAPCSRSPTGVRQAHRDVEEYRLQGRGGSASRP